MQSKNSNTYIIPSHITSFSVEQLTIYDEEHGSIVVENPEIYEVIVHLDSYHQHPTHLSVFEGREEGCHKFIKRTLRRQKIFKWIGYFVAGLAGSLLTVLVLLIQMIFFNNN